MGNKCFREFHDNRVMNKIYGWQKNSYTKRVRSAIMYLSNELRISACVYRCFLIHGDFDTEIFKDEKKLVIKKKERERGDGKLIRQYTAE